MTCEFFGISISQLNEAELLETIIKKLENGERIRIATLNSEILLRAYRQADYAKTLKSFELRVMDGSGPAYLARFLGYPVPPRIAGTDLVPKLANIAAGKGWKLFLLGGGQPAGSNRAAQSKLAAANSGLEVSGNGEVGINKLPDGSWSMPSELKEDIVKNGTQVLLVGLGQQKQEEWISQYWEELSGIKLAIGVGGALALIGGTNPRAPRWLRKGGLEWLWRWYQEPWRWRRMCDAVIIFPWVVLKDHLTRRKS